MCGRFTFGVEVDEAAGVFGASVASALAGFGPRYNIAPTEDAPVMIAAPEGRRMGPMSWGLAQRGWQGRRSGRLLINARSETVARRPSFREDFLARRCLVPADGFYEWQDRPEGRQPYWIHRPDHALFAMAAIWSPARRHKNGLDDSTGATFAVLTRPAPESIVWLHDRAPVILPGPSWTEWLYSATGPEELRNLLASAEPPDLAARPVSRKVNRVGYEGSHCIRVLQQVVCNEM